MLLTLEVVVLIVSLFVILVQVMIYLPLMMKLTFLKRFYDFQTRKSLSLVLLLPHPDAISKLEKDLQRLAVLLKKGSIRKII